MSEKSIEKKTRLKVFEITLIPILAILLYTGKMALRALPNIEVVSFFIIIFSLTLRKRIVFPAIYLFVLLEGLTYGFGFWWYMYLYIWAFLAIFTYIFRKIRLPSFWAIASGVYGLLFGLLCTFPYFFTKGWAFGVSWWISGLPYDLMHGFGNFAVCRLLFIPIMRAMGVIKRKYLS